MTDDRIDFSLLQPRARSSGLEGLVSRVNAQCAPQLAMRRSRRTTIQIVSWWRPAVAAALTIGVISTVILGRAPRRDERIVVAKAAAPMRVVSGARIQLARALGVPTLLATRLTRETPPTATDLLPELER
jgi:hypothetical protein